MAGYLSLGNEVPDLVIARKALPGSNDILMSIGQSGLFVGLVVATSIRILSNKDNVMSLFNPRRTAYAQLVSDDEQVKSNSFRKMEVFVIIAVGFIPYVCALFLKDNVNSIISLMSSLLCPFFIIIMPAWMNIKLKAQFNYSAAKVFFIKLYIAFFVILLSLSIAVNTYNFITGHDVIG